MSVTAVEVDEDPSNSEVFGNAASFTGVTAPEAITGATAVPAKSPANWIVPFAVGVAETITGAVAVEDGSKSPANCTIPSVVGVAFGTDPPPVALRTFPVIVRPEPSVMSVTAVEVDEDPSNSEVFGNAASFAGVTAPEAIAGAAAVPAKSPANWIVPCVVGVAGGVVPPFPSPA
jgi:hypothetical protein